MLKMIDTVADCYKNKRIFVWEVKRNSMAVFASLAFRGISIEGFISREERYIGETLFNRPIYRIEDFRNNNDVVIVATGASVKGNLPDGIKVYCCSEIMEIDPELRKKRIIVYGIGESAKKLFHRLEENGIMIDSFCVTDKSASEYMNLPVLSLNEIPSDERYVVIIATMYETYRREMQYNLEQKKVQTIYVDEFIPPVDNIQMSTFIQSLCKAIKEEKKIYIYTKEIDENAKFIVQVLKLYQVKVEGYLYSGEYLDEAVKDIYDMYENISDIFIIINEADKYRLQDACELLEELGFSLGAFNYIGLRNPAYNYKTPPRSIGDSLLGYSECGEKVGFHIYGQENPEDIRIVITGGSTSNDGTFRGVCWPKMLYWKLRDNGYHVTVYNGARCGHRVVQEFLQFIRDGWYFKPHFVVSMSGVNDSGDDYPETKNKFYLSHLLDKEKRLGLDKYTHGIEVQEDCFDFWLRIQRLMRAVSEENGAKFLCFLQPMKFGKEGMSLFEKCLHDDEKREADKFREKASSNDFYKNLIDIFDDGDGMYIDACHYTERAKEILADIVFDEMIRYLP